MQKDWLVGSAASLWSKDDFVEASEALKPPALTMVARIWLLIFCGGMAGTQPVGGQDAGRMGPQGFARRLKDSMRLRLAQDIQDLNKGSGSFHEHHPALIALSNLLPKELRQA